MNTWLEFTTLKMSRVHHKVEHKLLCKCFQELYCIFTFCTYFADYVDGKHITEIGAVGGCDVDMIDDMVGIMKRQNLLVDGDCLRLGSDVGKGN